MIKNNLTGRIFQHHKGTRYLVVGEAKEADSLEELVIYCPLTDLGVTATHWVHSKKNFLAKLPNGEDRFKQVTDTDDD